MSAYDFSNFERAGYIDNDVQMDSSEVIRDEIIVNTSKAVRSIQIYSPDLEQTLYNNQEFRSALLKFARDNHNARIDILVDDLSQAVHEGHLIISLAQQLPSIIEIKDTPADYQGMKISFILFDTKRFIFKPDRNHHHAIYSECKNRTSKLTDFFNSIWEHAAQNIHTRRMTI